MHSLKYYFYKYKYKRLNSNNNTWPVNYFNFNQVEIGNKTWGGIKILNYDRFHKTKVYIGSYCSIAAGVEFMLGGNHRFDRVSTFLYKQSGLIDGDVQEENIKDKGNIYVGDDVWIGYQSLILPGANIGRGTVIGARSVVSGDIPPYSVYVGNQIIKSRFNCLISQKLNELDYEKFDKLIECKPEVMEKFLYNDISDGLVDELNALIDSVD